MWSITGYDWKAPSAAYIEQKVSPKIHGGDVVLLHDGGHAAFGSDRSATVAAVDRLIARYLAEDYQFVTIPMMMGLGLSSTEAGVRRSSIT
jgi:peptidoglycan/xylan/chitin deacetylase (PgdA/CDA1 family)